MMSNLQENDKKLKQSLSKILDRQSDSIRAFVEAMSKIPAPPIWNRSRAIINAADVEKLEYAIGVDPASLEIDGDGRILNARALSFGLDIQTSEYVEQGTVFLVNEPKSAIHFESVLESDKLNNMINSFAHKYFNTDWIYGENYTSNLDPVTQSNRWQRRLGENMLAWGKRLEQNGWLDNPQIRWEYQKEVFRTISDTVRDLTVIFIDSFAQFKDWFLELTKGDE